MLKINNIKFKKCRIPLLLFAISISGIFLFQYLTFVPEYTHAQDISTTNPATAPIYEWSKLEYMQQMTSDACTSADIGDSKTLKDSRDGKTYWIAKLADSNCWMTQNLAIDLTGKTLTASDSNITSDWSPVSTWGTNSDTIAWQISTTGSEHASYGGYYSWQAATANTTPAGVGEAPSSICPKGWRLPTGGTSGEFQALVDKGKSSWTTSGNISGYWLGGTDNVAGAAFFPSGGYVDNGSLLIAGGNYWTSTSYSDADAYSLGFNSSGINPYDNSTRCLGLSVRCVAAGTSDSTPPSDPSSGINDPTLSVTIPNIITLSLSSEVVDIDTSTSNPAEGNFTATVTSNSKYNLSLSATAPEGQTPHTDLKNEDSNKTTSIPALSSKNPIVTEADESWWGIKCTNPTDSTNCTKTAYTGLTLTPETYFTSTSGTPTNGTETPFTIGIKVSPNLPSGTYSTSIQVTASSTGSN